MGLTGISSLRGKIESESEIFDEAMKRLFPDACDADAVFDYSFHPFDRGWYVCCA